MFDKNWKEEVCTIPNLLSLFRLLLIPVYMNIYLHSQRDRDYLLAGSILAVSCLTDLADGYIARKFHMVSRIGKVLDPLADKLTQFFLILSLSSKYRILYPMAGVFVIKELFQLIAMVIFIQKGKALTGALIAGKVCTTALFTSLTLLVLFPQLHRGVVCGLIGADTGLMLYSMYSYVEAYFGRNSKLKDLKTE